MKEKRSFDIFGKLDDMIYKPVECICNYLEEPLRALSSRRERKKMEKTAAIEKDMRQQEAELQEWKARQEAELQVDQRRWNAEIDAMIAEQESQRRDQLVESIKRYQIDLATATKDIVESIGLMSIELRKEANALIMEKTQEYRQLQKEATDNAMQRLDDINQRFANNERVRLKMEDSVINQMDAIVNAANKFISELAEDFKRLNMNTDSLMRMGMENINRYLEPMTKSLQVESNLNYQDLKQLEDGSVIDADTVEV